VKYISIHLYQKMLKHALKEGVKRDELMELPTPIDKAAELKAVPADHFFYLHEFLDDKVGPGFSIRVGQEMKIEDYGVLGLSWRTCSWAGEIFARAERYFKMLSNTYDFKVVEGKEESIIYLNREPHRRGLELSNEATLSATVVVLQAMTESEIRPTQVNFKHSAPAELSSYEQAFQCEILFDQAHYSMTYRTADLRMRTAKADREINQFLLERVEEETKGIALGGEGLADDVEHLIKNALPSGIPPIDEIAAQLGMSNRTLSRRLAEDSLSFRDLIRKSQEEVAKDLLKNSDRSLAEIAFETGFSDQTAFNRAFKRWTNLSPLEYRKQ
jgi:AraC-like DNA-binding protein